MAPHAEADSGSLHGDGQSNGHQAAVAATATRELFTVNSSNVTYTDNEILSKYTYRTTDVAKDESGKFVVTPVETVYEFKTERKVPKTGMMLVGLGGNNGTTVTAGIIANRRGLTSTIKLGTDTKTRKDVNIPFSDILPMVHPNDLVIGGWDISGLNLAEAMDRAQVLEPTLKQQVAKEMAQIVPLPSIYYPDFIAANQEDRADNVLPGTKACNEHVEQIRKNIRDFKEKNGLDKVIVQWTANTERYGSHRRRQRHGRQPPQGHRARPRGGVTVDRLLGGVHARGACPFINGSPQNTFVPGAIELAESTAPSLAATTSSRARPR
ncbi:inositol-3-phosphate synthase [Verticillium alfalfae VaMs.102]|uniref:Inositol-3-phosphate synthase n=1 Tax=Verticillium alfalfae (strain VaMs.102 / ATCC MYA-4576 / FGSC 10136) TaxID=526221 RepID=C9S5Y5_VERA1|nr:inositol-3-phosphate synthase [Verticillium alfalfae VaMs.102]EEY14324.1 inositol-3-phosphate synthase [Verticillium alfalfae VaMs.102]